MWLSLFLIGIFLFFCGSYVLGTILLYIGAIGGMIKLFLALGKASVEAEREFRKDIIKQAIKESKKEE